MKKVCRCLVVCIVLLAVGILVYNSLTVQKSGNGNGGSVNWGKDLQELANELSRDAMTDEECVQMFYRWVIENIAYDYAYDGIYQHENISNTLRTRKGICFDYAMLFAAMCRSQGIHCYVVDGYVKGNPSAQHSWNRVFYGNSWWDVDTTNDAVSRQNGQPIYGFRLLEHYDQEDAYYEITRIY